MKIERDKVTFSTGTVKSANCGIIGLSPKMTVSEGYDGGFHQPREEWMDDDDFDGLTNEEQVELAEYMIERWQEFKSNASQEI